MPARSIISKLIIMSMFIVFSAQSPTIQKRMKVLERAYGKKELKQIPSKSKKKKRKKKTNIRVVKKTERQAGVIVSKAESKKISEGFEAWKNETIALEKKAKAGLADAKYELLRRKEIRIHLDRIAKIKALYSYAKRTKNTALMGRSMLLMNEENNRFEAAMLKIQSHK